MHHRQKSKYLLFVSIFLAFSLVIIALFSLYFSDKTLYAKKQELMLQKKYIELEKKIAQKKRLYRQISDNIQELQDLIDQKNDTDEDIQKVINASTPIIKKMVLANLPIGYPVDSKRVTSSFGYRIHPIFHEERFHHGIDIGGKMGLPIYATADGVVEFSGYTSGGYGNLVILSHNFGFKTMYGHMQKDLRVKKGDFVKKGEIIGYLGNSGLSTGPHLHYEIRYLRRYLDPKYFLSANSKKYEDLLRATQQIRWQSLINSITASYQKFTSL